MKKSAAIPLAFIVLTALTGCLGDYAESAEMEASSRAASSASPTTLKAIPDVAGKTYKDAKATLNNLGLTVISIGKDGKQWSNTSPGADVKAVSTDPAAGTKTDKKTVRLILDASESDR